MYIDEIPFEHHHMHILAYKYMSLPDWYSGDPSSVCLICTHPRWLSHMFALIQSCSPTCTMPGS